MEVIIKDNKFILIDESKKEWGFVQFKKERNLLTILKTYVNPDARGKGVAKLLTEFLFNYAIKENFILHLICSYSVDFYNKNKAHYLGLKVILDNEPKCML